MATTQPFVSTPTRLRFKRILTRTTQCCARTFRSIGATKPSAGRCRVTTTSWTPAVTQAASRRPGQTWETPVIDGIPEHRDAVLLGEDATNDRMMVCVSRSAGPHLTLDLGLRSLPSHSNPISR